MTDAIDANDEAAAGTALGSFITVYKRLIGDIRAVPAPPGDAKRAETLYALYDRLAAAYSDLAEAFTSGDDTAVADAGDRISTLATRRSDAAKAFGFKVCGTG